MSELPYIKHQSKDGVTDGVNAHWRSKGKRGTHGQGHHFLGGGDAENEQM